MERSYTYVGLYTAVASMVAAGASLLFGILESSHGSVHLGKGLALSLGAMSYLVIGIRFIVAPDGDSWDDARVCTVGCW